MNKKEYIAPRAEELNLLRPMTVLAHFSADALIEDFEEIEEDNHDMLGPNY